MSRSIHSLEHLLNMLTTSAAKRLEADYQLHSIGMQLIIQVELATTIGIISVKVKCCNNLTVCLISDIEVGL